MANQNDKRTASQRIDDLERAVMSLYQVSNNFSRENGLIKDALRLMSNRVVALIQLLSVSTSGQVSEQAVDDKTRENQVEELKMKVKNLIDQGFFVPADTVEDNTFIVGYEAEPDAEDGTPGKIVNTRLQFTLASLEKEIQDKLKGAKVNETIKFKDDALVFKVQEVYKIVNPTPEPVVENAEAPATEEIAAAPVAQQSSENVEASTTSEASDTQVAGN